MFITDFPVEWYAYITLWFVVWLAIPPAPWKKDVKNNVLFGLIGTVLGIAVEGTASILGLWTYTRGNWPVILWPMYFVASIVWHEIYRLFERRKKD